MKRAPLTYRRPTRPKEDLARLRAIERAFHVRAFGEELARVNLDLTIEQRRRYLEQMRLLARRNRAKPPIRAGAIAEPAAASAARRRRPADGSG